MTTQEMKKVIEDYLEKNPDEFNIVDNAVGVCAGVTAGTAANRWLKIINNPMYGGSNAVTKAGTMILSLLAGIECGTKARKKARDLRVALDIYRKYKDAVPVPNPSVNEKDLREFCEKCRWRRQDGSCDHACYFVGGMNLPAAFQPK